ncbi:hypothetical protein BD779DRAFT_1675730 [Infundibulicybe gibba]|nr:hypothetical protein BD779DRAFT_1675730 [Infundibulicybe gibba]
MPGLETLILRRCFPPPTPSTMEDTHVNLSNLKQLEVAASMARCTCFLRQITISTNTIVLLNIGCPSIPGRHIEKILRRLPSHPSLYNLPPTTLKFTWHDYGSFKVDVWTAQRRTKVKRSSNASIKLNFSWDWEDSQGVRSPSNVTWMCFAALASPQLRSFRMSGGDIDGWGVGIWRHLARIAPNLQALALGSKALGVKLCMALNPPDGPDLAPADYCFPALSYLELEAPYDHPMPTPGGGNPRCR